MKLHLFDTKAYDKGEFTAFDLGMHLQGSTAQQVQITSLKFSPCGKYLLTRAADLGGVRGQPGRLLLIDAFDGELICEYKGVDAQPPTDTGSNIPLRTPQPSFSPDSQYVLCGAPSGEVLVWNTINAGVVRRLGGHTTQPVCAMFCPTKA